MEIKKEIIDEATDCNKNLICLKDPNVPLCKVTKCKPENIYYVACDNPEGCNYAVVYEDGAVCSCPVRNEIYFKYKI
jgi:hypothetical protein